MPFMRPGARQAGAVRRSARGCAAVFFSGYWSFFWVLVFFLGIVLLICFFLKACAIVTLLRSRGTRVNPVRRVGCMIQGIDLIDLLGRMAKAAQAGRIGHLTG